MFFLVIFSCGERKWTSKPSPPESFRICTVARGMIAGHRGGELREGIVVYQSEAQESEISGEGWRLSDVDQALKYLCGLHLLFLILFLISRIFNLGMQLTVQK